MRQVRLRTVAPAKKSPKGLTVRRVTLLMSDDANKRRHGRITVSAGKMAADFDGENQPNPDSFYPITLKDFSTTGARFLSGHYR